jgi:hypothetical protein
LSELFYGSLVGVARQACENFMVGETVQLMGNPLSSAEPTKSPAGARRRKRWWLLALAGALGVLAGPAAAQTLFDRDANIGVLDRPRPDYQALGLHVGAWMIYPKLTTIAEYDDNIFAPVSGVSDEIFKIEPELTVQSNWNRHSLRLDVSSAFSEYASHASQDTVEYQAEAKGQIDVLHDFTIRPTVHYFSAVIPRTDAGYAGAQEEPLSYSEAYAQIELAKTFNRLKVTASFTDAYDTYANGKLIGGGALDEHFRNHNQLTGDVRLDYAVSPSLLAFVEETVSSLNYPDRARNSTSTQTLAGVNFQLTHLITAEIGAGYITNTFADPAYHSAGSPSGRLKLTWYPTQLLTLSATAQQAFYDSGIRTSPSTLQQSLDVQADYELLRNLIISAQGGGTWDQYRGIDRRDDIYRASLQFNYLLNRLVGLALRYDRLTQNSTGLDRGYQFTDNRVGLALTLQF